MRRIIDLSDNQGNIDIDQALAASDATWSKCADYAWVAAHGWPGDDLHAPVVERAMATGKLIGTYWFPRPGFTSPQTQVEAWAAHSYVDLPLAPMVDLEVPGTLSGGSLTAWVDEFLSLVPRYFGVTPVLYWSYSFQQGHGMGMPASPHVPMVAEYHYGDSPFLWANLDGWEQRAYARYGGPDVPAGYSYGPRDLIWQFTSKSQCPGFPGLVDHSFIPDWAWDAITGGTLGSSSLEDNDLTPEQAQQLATILQTVTVTQPTDLNTHVRGLYTHMDQDREAIIARILGDLGVHVTGLYTHMDQDRTFLQQHGDANWAGGLGTAEVDIDAVLKSLPDDKLAAKLGAKRLLSMLVTAYGTAAPGEAAA